MTSHKPAKALGDVTTWPEKLFVSKEDMGQVKEPLVSNRDHPDISFETEPKPQSVHQWQPGGWKRMPLLAGLSIMMTLVLSGAMVVIVIVADGTSTQSWMVSPTVLSAIVATVANILIQLALAKGIAVSWWRRSIEEPTSVRDLHARWVVGQGVADAVQEIYLRGPNIGAIASIMATIVAINSPLIQRAITPGLGTFDGQFDLGDIRIVQQLPLGYSGIWNHQTKSIEYPTDVFMSLTRNYFYHPGVILKNRGGLGENLASCDGTCAGRLRGAGLSIECNTPSIVELPSINDANGAYSKATDVFLSALEYREYPDYAVKSPGSATNLPTKDKPRSITYSALYKTENGCPTETKGVKMVSQQCTLRPAIVDYNIAVINGTLSVDQDYLYESDEVVSIETDEQMRADVDPLRPANYTHGSSTYGGVAALLARRFSSRVSIKLENGSWTQEAEGLLALELPRSGKESLNGSCAPGFSDPAVWVFEAARALMFRASVEVPVDDYSRRSSRVWGSDGEDIDIYANHTQRLKGTHKGLSTVYIANYPFMYAAAILTFLTGLVVTPLFYGFSNLGRQVSMSPLEIAKAFDPHQLREAASNSDAKAMLGALGNKQVNYGIACPQDKPGSSALVFGDAEVVRRPKVGARISM